MGNGCGANLLGIASNGQSLEDAFRADRNGVAIIAKDITEDHVLQGLLVVFLRHVEGDVLLCTELVGILFVCLELFCTEAARIGTGSIYFVTFLLCQVHHGVAGIKPATEGDNNLAAPLLLPQRGVLFILVHIYSYNLITN